MKIVVLCPHPPGRAPGQRLKFEQYYESWRREGFSVDVRPFWSASAWDILYLRGHRIRKLCGVIGGYIRRLRDLRDARRADLVYLFLEALPLGPIAIERLIHRAGVPLVYDIDDLVYTAHSSAANRIMFYVRSARGERKVRALCRLGDHVIVCTEHLAEFARTYNSGVTLISSTVDTRVYRPRPSGPDGKPVTIGWSGSHSTSAYVQLLRNVLKQLQEEDGVSVVVVGDENFVMDGVTVEAKPWREETEVAELSRFDVGIYPLPNEPWIRGKSGLKAIQYMSLGVPTVAQRTDTNGGIIEHGANGFLADSRDEWLSVLRTLVKDRELRVRIGTAARKTVVERYSVEANEAKYLDVLRQVLSARRSS